MNWKSNVVYKDHGKTKISRDSLRPTSRFTSFHNPQTAPDPRLIKHCIAEQQDTDVEKQYEKAAHERESKLAAAKDRVRKRRGGRPVSRQLLRGSPLHAAPTAIEKMALFHEKENMERKVHRTEYEVKPEFQVGALRSFSRGLVAVCSKQWSEGIVGGQRTGCHRAELVGARGGAAGPGTTRCDPAHATR